MEKSEKMETEIKAQEQKYEGNEEYAKGAFFLFYNLLLYGPGFIQLENNASEKLNGETLA